MSRPYFERTEENCRLYFLGLKTSLETVADRGGQGPKFMISRLNTDLRRLSVNLDPLQAISDRLTEGQALTVDVLSCANATDNQYTCRAFQHAQASELLSTYVQLMRTLQTRSTPERFAHLAAIPEASAGSEVQRPTERNLCSYRRRLKRSDQAAVSTSGKLDGQALFEILKQMIEVLSRREESRRGEDQSRRSDKTGKSKRPPKDSSGATRDYQVKSRNVFTTSVGGTEPEPVQSSTKKSIKSLQSLWKTASAIIDRNATPAADARPARLDSIAHSASGGLDDRWQGAKSHHT